MQCYIIIIECYVIKLHNWGRNCSQINKCQIWKLPNMDSYEQFGYITRNWGIEIFTPFKERSLCKDKVAIFVRLW